MASHLTRILESCIFFLLLFTIQPATTKDPKDFLNQIPENYHGIEPIVIVGKAEKILQSDKEVNIGRLSPEWHVELHFRIDSLLSSPDWCKVMMVTSGASFGSHGSRVPALTLQQRPNMRLEVATSLNHNDNYRTLESVALNTDYHVIIQQKYVKNGVYEMTAFLNGVEIMRADNTQPRQFYNVKALASTKMTNACDVTISDFKVTNFV
ncbi:uncharacterized protein [Clytia hemisphaerica]